MEIQEIKKNLSIKTVLAHYSLKSDRNNRLCCPWHNDKTPSLQIYSKTNTWTCFSSNCAAGSGDAIEMIQRMEKGTKHEAILKAKELLNHLPSQNQNGMNKNESQDLQEVFTQQRKSLHRTKKALQYLKDRNLDPMNPPAGRAGSEIGFNSYQSGYKQLKNCVTFPLKDRENNIVSLYGRSFSDHAKGRQAKKGSNHYYPHRPRLNEVVTGMW